jgi:serine/threonine-protein kinase
MAAALAAAHERGLVHRDFKPANVMLTESGDAKVTDFGIAQLEAASAAADTKLTQAGTVMGTPTYMSPEQARGDQVGASSDVYALGATFYEMLCGEPVFTGTLTQVLAAHITQTPDPLSSRGVELPEEVEGLVQRMLLKEPNERPSLSDVLAGLDSVSS